MSAKFNDVPDAWDDDWEAQIDNQEPISPAQPESAKRVSSRAIKAQRRAQHAEFNRQLWAEAESPQSFHFLESRPSPPLSSDYKPAVKVLTRKPQTTGNSSPSHNLESPTVGIQRLTIASSRTASTTAVDGGAGERGDNDDDISDNERKRREQQLTPEQRLAKTQREREEKQRKYEEVRERLFGTLTPGSGASSPGSTTPPRQQQQQQQQQQGGDNKWKGRNRSAGGGKNSRERREIPSTSNKSRQLFDPTYSAKPSSTYLQRKERGQADPQKPQTQPSQPPPQAPIRSPRGPDGSGRGGFGFGQRGGKNV